MRVPVILRVPRIKMPIKSYELLGEKLSAAQEPSAIKCLICGLVSHNLGDVLQRYCAKCRIFHDDRQSG